MSPRTSGKEGERTRLWDGHGYQHPARTAAEGASLRTPQDGRGISAPRGWPRVCVATDERDGTEGEQRPAAAAEISAPGKLRWGGRSCRGRRTDATIVSPRKWPRRYAAVDERWGVDAKT